MIGVVYKISNDVDDKIYIGSTKQSLNKRWTDHKYDCRTPHRKKYNCDLYTHIRLHGEDKFHIECLETYECEDLKALHAKEQEYYDNLKPAFNGQRPSRSHMTKKEIDRERYINTKANQTEESKQHEKQRVKKWHTENKEKIKKYKAELFQKKKAALTEKHRLSPQITCGCGSVFKQCNQSYHFKTKKHKNWLATQN